MQILSLITKNEVFPNLTSWGSCLIIYAYENCGPEVSFNKKIGVHKRQEMD